MNCMPPPQPEMMAETVIVRAFDVIEACWSIHITSPKVVPSNQS